MLVVSDQSDNKENNSNNKTSRIKINQEYVKLVPEISKSDYQSLNFDKRRGLFSNILNQNGVILDAIIDAEQIKSLESNQE